MSRQNTNEYRQDLVYSGGLWNRTKESDPPGHTPLSRGAGVFEDGEPDLGFHSVGTDITSFGGLRGSKSFPK